MHVSQIWQLPHVIIYWITREPPTSQYYHTSVRYMWHTHCVMWFSELSIRITTHACFMYGWHRSQYELSSALRSASGVEFLPMVSFFFFSWKQTCVHLCVCTCVCYFPWSLCVCPWMAHIYIYMHSMRTTFDVICSNGTVYLSCTVSANTQCSYM